jgi:crotonobetainyl-CoA:carnitine CoA-transferase CaiB-like acyl-CoA transferase
VLAVRAPSPALGEHNDAVYLGLLGLERARYDALKTARVI